MSLNKMAKQLSFRYRIFSDILILGLIFIAPWWLTLPLVCVAIFFFHYFGESLFFALLLDGFHSVENISFGGTNAFFLTTIGAVFLVSIFLKPRLSFY